MNPKTLPSKGRKDKLIDRGRSRVFIGYTNITAQLKVYVPDLGYTIRSSIVDIDESIPGGTTDLQIRNSLNSQGILTDLIIRGANTKNLSSTSPELSTPRSMILVVEILVKEALVVTYTIADQDQDNDLKSVVSDTI